MQDSKQKNWMGRNWKYFPSMLSRQVLRLCLLFFVVMAPPARAAQTGSTTTTNASPTLAERLMQHYQDEIETLSTSARKKTEGPQGSLLILSRVTYKRPDHIHVENYAPSERRIIANGKELFYYVQGAPRGFSRPIEELNEAWLASLRNIPGSPMEHLRKLANVPEQPLPATDRYPVRAAYQAPRVFVVLCCDAEGRLARIEFYETAERKKLTAQYDYSNFLDISPTCSIPRLHKGNVYLPDGETITETRRFDNMIVNEPVAERLFMPELFFDEDIDFVADFEATL